jgi:hypothetical protein
MRKLFVMIGLFGVNAHADISTTPPPPSTINAPWIETFQQAGTTVAYVGAVHHSSVTYPNAIQDPIFETVAQEFAQEKPQAVIVEGVDPSQLSGFLNFAKSCAAANYNLNGQFCDEPEFTAVEAMNSGAEVFTGEPSATDVLKYFEGAGYSVQDVLAFDVMINIPVEKAHTPLTDSNFPTFLNGVVANSEKTMGINVAFTATDFQNWYAQNMLSPASYLDIATNDTGPTPVVTGQPTKLNQMSATDSVMRDGNVIKTIQMVSSKYQRALVVYGASHLVDEWNQLIAMLGTPTFSKPY